MVVVGVFLVLFSVFMLYEGFGLVFGYPIIYNASGVSNVYLAMARGVVLRYSLLVGLVGLVLGIFCLIGLKRAKIGDYTGQNRILISVYLILNILCTIILII